MTDTSLIGGLYQPPPAPAHVLKALRFRQEKFFPPHNAVPDRPIDLKKPHGINGYEAARIRREKGKLALKEAIERNLQLLKEGALHQGPKHISLDIPVTVRDIQDEVCRQFDVDLQALKADRRSASIVAPRHVAMLLSKELTNLTLPNLGKRFRRDHATILHAINKYQWLTNLLAMEEAKTLSELVAKAKFYLMEFCKR